MIGNTHNVSNENISTHPVRYTNKDSRVDFKTIKASQKLVVIAAVVLLSLTGIGIFFSPRVFRGLVKDFKPISQAPMQVADTSRKVHAIALENNSTTIPNVDKTECAIFVPMQEKMDQLNKNLSQIGQNLKTLIDSKNEKVTKSTTKETDSIRKLDDQAAQIKELEDRINKLEKPKAEINPFDDKIKNLEEQKAEQNTQIKELLEQIQDLNKQIENQKTPDTSTTITGAGGGREAAGEGNKLAHTSVKIGEINRRRPEI